MVLGRTKKRDKLVRHKRLNPYTPLDGFNQETKRPGQTFIVKKNIQTTIILDITF